MPGSVALVIAGVYSYDKAYAKTTRIATACNLNGGWPFVLVPRLYHGKVPEDRWDIGGRIGIILIFN